MNVKETMKKMFYELLTKTDDKLGWGLVQHGPKHKKDEIMKFLIYKFSQIIYEGEEKKRFIKPFRKVNWVQFQDDNPILVRSWDKICKRMAWPYYETQS